MSTKNSAVVFAYNDVGVRCLSVLLAHEVDVPLVVTHQDDPAENIWFESVQELAGDYGIPVVTPRAPEEIAGRLRELAPDFLFSFYYRYLIPGPMLETAGRGALNMHGSLLPHFRGRVPVNWAIIRGERETGASLHYMEAKPDAGDLVDQQAVPILPNDTALQVFRKVTVAAEQVLDRSLPALLAGTAPRQALDLSQGSYFGRRRPEDGRIDWRAAALDVHNLVRAVAPPYPGAFANLQGRELKVLGSFWRGEPARHGKREACLYWEDHRCYVDCADGNRLELTALALDGRQLDQDGFQRLFGDQLLYLGD